MLLCGVEGEEKERNRENQYEEEELSFPERTVNNSCESLCAPLAWIITYFQCDCFRALHEHGM